MEGQGSTTGCSAIGWMDGWMEMSLKDRKQTWFKVLKQEEKFV
jgi:hypothetical protein